MKGSFIASTLGMPALLIVLALPAAAGAAMVTETWTGDDGDPWPTQWTALSLATVATRDIQNGRGHYENGGTTGNVIHDYINTATAEDVDQTVTFSFSDNRQTFGLLARLHGAIGPTTDGSLEPTNSLLYNVQVAGNSGTITILWRTGGLNSSLVTDNSFGTLSENVNYSLRFAVETVSPGLTELKAKLWLATDPEPTSWLIETTDNKPELQGISGQFGFYMSMRNNRHIYVDNYTATNLVVIPEPGVMTQLGLCSVALLCRRRKSRNGAAA